MGHRALFGYGYHGIGMQNQTVNVADLERVNDRWIRPSEGLLTLGICSRGPENNSIELCRGEWEAARKMGIRISTHMGTSLARVKDRQGVKQLEKAGLLGPDRSLSLRLPAVSAQVLLLQCCRSPILMRQAGGTSTYCR